MPDVARGNLADDRRAAVAHRLLSSRGMSDDDRPRERLWRRGVTAIGDEELIAILLGTGVRDHPALAVAAELVKSSGGVVAVSRASPRELAQVIGVGAARAARIAAAFELGRRAIESEQRREVLSQAEDVFRCVGPRLAGLQQEVFLAIGLDIRNGLLDIVEVARGSVHGVEVHPREVFRPFLVRMVRGEVPCSSTIIHPAIRRRAPKTSRSRAGCAPPASCSEFPSSITS